MPPSKIYIGMKQKNSELWIVNIWIRRNIQPVQNTFLAQKQHKFHINKSWSERQKDLGFNTCKSKDINDSRKSRINLNNAACTAIQQIHECWHRSLKVVAAAIWLEIPTTKWGGFCVIKSRHDR